MYQEMQAVFESFWLIRGKETGTSVIQPHESEFSQEPELSKEADSS